MVPGQNSAKFGGLNHVVPSRYRRTHVATFIIEIPLLILIVFGVFWKCWSFLFFEKKEKTSTFFRWWLSDKMKNSTRVSISTDRSSGGGKDFAIFGAQNWKSGRRSCSYSWNLKRSRRPSGRRSIKFYEKLMILKKGNASILKDLGALQFKRPRCRGPWGKNYQNPLIS